MQKHHQIVIIGAGTAGIMVATQLLRKNKQLDIAIIEPSKDHWYQPAWTLVGAGTFNMRKTKHTQASVMPKDVKWILDSVTAVHPKENYVTTKDNHTYSYDYLVVAPGLVNDYSLLPGLEEALKKGVACSNYVDPEHTWKALQQFNGGNAIFTQPNTPIKCGGAPQKAMYLAADYLRKKGLDGKTHISFLTPGSVIFGVKNIAEELLRVIKRYDINLKLSHVPVKIDADKKCIYFKDVTPADKKNNSAEIPGSKITEDNLLEVPFNFLHLAPPQAAPDFIRYSELANDAGWADVDINSMQHKKYANIYALGDVAALPTAKTGAAVRKQAPVVVDNILKSMNGQPADNKSYEGYSSCPLVTGYGKMVLAEFNYKNEFTPDPQLKSMLIFNSDKEHWRLWMLKKYGLPYMYWHKMMKGTM